MAPYKIRKECYLLRSCLADARRMLLFVVGQVFLPKGEVWLMCHADTQCTVGRGKETKGQKEIFCLNFSYLAIKYEFYFLLVYKVQVSVKFPFYNPDFA